MNILEAQNVTKSYTNKVAIDNVSIEVKRGSIHGLLGPNGAGKTTLIRTINRIIVPDSGKIILDGKEITQQDVFKIGYMPEERGLYKKMKVGEQIVFFARLKGLSKNDALKSAKKALKEFEILGWWDKKIEDLSKGMAQKIQFIITTIHAPKLLILDEPFSGFDPINANLLKSKVLNLKNNGTTIILSTHDMSSVEAICDDFTLINQSKNILSGEVNNIREKYSKGVYRFGFLGKNPEMMNSLSDICSYENISDITSKEDLYTITLKDRVTVSDFISRVNPKVELTQFSKIIPSMNDIFIRAVEGEIL